jgi:glycosidase
MGTATAWAIFTGCYEKLDYIKSLGADGIWFSPLYPSPGADCGYDIADYMDIAPEYGGLEQFKKVLAGAHQRGMKVIMDLVINHTSDEHPWFQQSRRRIEPYTDYYIWRPREARRQSAQQLGQHVRGEGLAVGRGAGRILHAHLRREAARSEHGQSLWCGRK